MNGRGKTDFSETMGIIILLCAAVIIFVLIICCVRISFHLGSERYLDIQLSPDGYPEIGTKWTIKVWKVEEIPGYSSSIRTPAVNATVKITIFSDSLDEKKENYFLQTDKNGECEFVYSEPKIHKFQVSLKGYRNDSFTPNTHFISSEKASKILSIFSYNYINLILILISLIYTSYSFRIFKQSSKIEKYLNWLIIIFLGSILLVYSIGIIIANEWKDTHTAWGFLVNESYNTLNNLADLILFFILVFIILNLVSLAYKFLMHSSKKNPPLDRE